MPFTHQWDEAKVVPKGLFAKCAEAGWLAAVVGAPWPSKYLSASVLSLLVDFLFDDTTDS